MTENFIRSFIAININEPNKQAISEIQRVLKKSEADVSWVKPENLHLTLKFLGDVSSQRIEMLIRLFPALFSSWTGFPISITHLGVFPRIEFPKIVWLGIEENAEKIVSLAEHVENSMAGHGFPKERRPFSPHLTIGRVRSPRNKHRLTQAIKEQPLESPLKQTVDNIILFQSTLTPQGPIYQELSEVKLS